MKRFAKQPTLEPFDVIIIGGGITGAAIAYEAASRGLRAALFEKGDFSSATSAASSKMIHGGLRYLYGLEYRLVWESLRERSIMTRIAPNFVYPCPMMFPHYRACLKSNKRLIQIGLTLYDVLARAGGDCRDPSKNMPRHRTLSTEKALAIEPVLKRRGLTGASIFYDGISIFPERLALAFIKSAVHYNARVANYAKVTGFAMDRSRKRVYGVRVTDVFYGKTQEARAPVTINCSGPWADHVLDLPPFRKASAPLKRSEGVHIITRRIIPPKMIVSALTPTGRHCFLIPWRNHTLIGTTDKPYPGHPDDYRVTRKSIGELIQSVNASFEGVHIGLEDVLYSYGGLRPLVYSRTRETYRSSRKYEIYDHEQEGIRGLITVEGGKWTTSRGLAQKLVDYLTRKTTRPIGPSISAKTFLKGSEIVDMTRFLARFQKENTDFAESTLVTLSKYYGKEAQKVLKLARGTETFKEILNEDGEIAAQVIYAVRHEMARTLADVAMRRTGIATLGNPGKKVLQKTAALMGRELHWDLKKQKNELDRTSALLKIPVE